MIAEVLKRKNLYKAHRQVLQNRGSSGIDGMTVHELASHLEVNGERIITEVLNHTYVPDAILGTVRRCGRDTQGKGENPITGDSNSNRQMVTTGSEPGANDKVRVKL